MRKLAKLFLLIICAFTLSGCGIVSSSIEFFNVKNTIKNTAVSMMKCIAEKDAEGLFSYYNDYLKENRETRSLSEIRELFDFIEGDVTEYKYRNSGGGMDTTKNGRHVYYTRSPRCSFTTSAEKNYTVQFGFIVIDEEHPEYVGIDTIRIYEDDDHENELWIGEACPN